MTHVRLGVGLRTLLLLAHNLPSHNVFPDIVLLGQVEEPPDLSRTLGAEAFGEDDVGEPGDLVVALLDDDDGQDRDIGADNATTDRLAAALACAADAVARVAVRKQELDTVGQEDTLLHRETLLVISAGDAEHIALPFVAERVSGDFLSDFLVVDEATVNDNKYAVIARMIQHLTHYLFSSSMSTSFWAPVAGSVNCTIVNTMI